MRPVSIERRAPGGMRKHRSSGLKYFQQKWEPVLRSEMLKNK
ncbi:hypothetical protein CES85_1295 [Ochrobactrum quorumnocens]|uniref:Uncharacterized protein n=1 Tax=Ochrobactrum quorumnocens TaxID=271865 RepID=A0A248UFV8_9HYPH|nr:hypothetical protein CES85_1295 [[Ochrobactrum] quorumnocens]